MSVLADEAKAAFENPFGKGILKRISHGIGALSLGAVINILSQVSVIPLAMYAWGKVHYGEWLVLTGLLASLRFADLGLQTYAVNRICSSYSRGDRKDVQYALDSTLMVQCPLALGFFILIAAILFFVPLGRILQLRTVSNLEVTGVALLLALEFLFNVPMGVVGGLYRATGRLSRAALIGASQQLIILILTLALIAGHASFLALAGARLASVFAVSLWILFDLRRLYPWLKLWPEDGDWREGLAMIGPGLFFLLIPVADYLSGQCALTVIQRTLEGGEVSRFVTHRTIANFPRMASALLTIAAGPDLTALHARAESGSLSKVLLNLTKVNIWVVGALTLGILPFLPWIYPSWTAGRLILEPWTLAFLIIQILLWSIWGPSMAMLAAANRPARIGIAFFADAVLSSILIVVLTPRMGIKGAALALLLGDTCVAAWIMPLLASREIGSGYGGLWAQTFSAFLHGIGIPAGLGIGAWLLFPHILIRYFVILPASSVTALALIWRDLSSSERETILHVCRRAWASLGGPLLQGQGS